MSRRVFESLTKNSPLMRWAEQKGYEPAETEDSLAFKIDETQQDIWRIQGQIEDLEIELDELQGVLRRLEGLRAAIEDQAINERRESVPILLIIRPAGAADDIQ